MTNYDNKISMSAEVTEDARLKVEASLSSRDRIMLVSALLTAGMFPAITIIILNILWK